MLAPDPARPVALRIAGAYNGRPVSLEGSLGPSTVLRKAAIPYSATLAMASGDTTLASEGTMADPLNADGVRSRVTLRAPTPRVLLATAGTSAELGVAIELAGTAERKGDLWRLTDARGMPSGSDLTASLLRFIEGASGQPAAVVVALDVVELDLDRIAGRGEPGGQRAHADLPLAPGPRQDALIEARLGVGN